MKFSIFVAVFAVNSVIFSSVFAEDELHPCPEVRTIQSEKGIDQTFCKLDGRVVSEDCFAKGKDCELLRDLNKKKLRSDATLSAISNPGSKICRQLKWKVFMGKLFDGSKVCTCQHPSGESIVCTSLI